jgi:hypothetical protein
MLECDWLVVSARTVPLKFLKKNTKREILDNTVSLRSLCYQLAKPRIDENGWKIRPDATEATLVLRRMII